MADPFIAEHHPHVFHSGEIQVGHTIPCRSLIRWYVADNRGPQLAVLIDRESVGRGVVTGRPRSKAMQLIVSQQALQRLVV
ncbi:hypothetical protein D3C87_1636890 [compost metagenome]